MKADTTIDRLSLPWDSGNARLSCLCRLSSHGIPIRAHEYGMEIASRDKVQALVIINTKKYYGEKLHDRKNA